jgi:hypothetical protein
MLVKLTTSKVRLSPLNCPRDLIIRCEVFSKFFPFAKVTMFALGNLGARYVLLAVSGTTFESFMEVIFFLSPSRTL